MTEITRISTNTPWEPLMGYSRAVRAGNLVSVSGTTATDEDGGIVGINQMYVQTRQALANLASALSRAGATLANVTRTRVFVTDISRFEEVARAHREFFGEVLPATSCVEVRRLVHPDMLIEIEADAVLNAQSSTQQRTKTSRSASKPAKRRVVKKPAAKKRRRR